MASHEGPRSARLIIEKSGARYRLCTLSWSVQDASLFVSPFSGASEYFAGSHPMAAGQASIQIPYRAGASFAKAPKLSVHESGQLHVKAPTGEIVGGPIHLDHLRGWRGQQVLTTAIDDLDLLPKYGHTPRTEGADQDIVMQLSRVHARLAIYLNSEEPRFDDPTQAVVGLSRGSLGSTLWVGLALFPNDALAHGSTGVSIIAGVDPFDSGSEGELLYIRAQGLRS